MRQATMAAIPNKSNTFFLIRFILTQAKGFFPG